MQAGLTLEDIESFEFNALDLDDFQTFAATCWFICGETSNLGHFLTDTLKTDERQLQVFFEEVSGQYKNENPYHHWLHAVDVGHCVYRFLDMCKAKEILSASDRYGHV